MIFAVSLFALQVRAQWYAPQTCFHDQVQRVFPVELARVLAWRENVAANAGIAEVRFDVTTAQDGATAWMLQWLNAQGGVIKEVRVAYPATLLHAGEGFYHDVARQVWLAGWIGFSAADGGVLETSFWEGMGGLGMSRMATVRGALASENEVRRVDDAGAAARHAGRLLACAMPGLLRQVTLDSAVAARGAAWLALCDVTRPEGGGTDALKRAWSTVLWLARRHDQSAELWRLHAPGPVSEADAAGDAANIARGWWNFVLSPHERSEVCLRAAHYDAPAWGVAMLVEDARVSNSILPMAASLKLIADIEHESAHDYMVQIAEQIRDRDAKMLYYWIQDARGEWLQAVRAFGDEALGSIPGASEALAEASNAAVEMASRQPGSPIITGYPEAANLIRLGYRDGAGKLEPVATVSLRDVLNHGWEFSGLMCAALVRYHSALKPQGDDAVKVQAMARTLMEKIPEMGPFFQQNGWNAQLPGVDNYDRFQRMEWGASIMLFAPATVLGVPKPEQPNAAYNPNRALAMMQRGWGLWEHQTWSLWALLNSTADPQFVTSMTRKIAEEGGSTAALAMLFVMDNPVNAASVARLPDADAVRAWLRERMPASCVPWRTEGILKRSSASPRECAQALERAYWETAAGGDQFLIGALDNYIIGCDPEAAIRLHDQAFGQIEYMGIYASRIGMWRGLFALIKNDLPAMRKVQGFQAAHGYSPIMTRFFYALGQGNREQAAQIYTAMRMQQALPGWESTPDFLKLWQKLEDFSAGERTAFLAQPAFRDNIEPFLLWMLARHLRLDGRDAANLFGGDFATGERRLFVAYLRKDREKFEALTNEVFSKKLQLSGTGLVMFCWMRHELCKELLGPDTPDLRPEGWQPLETQLLEIILKRRAARLAETTTPTVSHIVPSTPATSHGTTGK